jgi:hypothetical protein
VCFRGRGPWQGEDGFAGIQGSKEYLKKRFAKMSKQRHITRTSVKWKDVQRLRTFRFDSKLEDEMKNLPQPAPRPMKKRL